MLDMCTITTENLVKFNNYFLILEIDEYINNPRINGFHEYFNSCNQILFVFGGR